MQDWDKYSRLCDDLRDLRNGQKKVSGKLKNLAKKGTNFVFKEINREERYSKIEQEIADKLFSIQEYLLDSCASEIEQGKSYQNIIDIDQFQSFKNNPTQIKRYIVDHYNTLRMERNSILSHTFHIDPVFSAILGIGKILAGAAVALLGVAFAYYTIL